VPTEPVGHSAQKRAFATLQFQTAGERHAQSAWAARQSAHPPGRYPPPRKYCFSPPYCPRPIPSTAAADVSATPDAVAGVNTAATDLTHGRPTGNTNRARKSATPVAFVMPKRIATSEPFKQISDCVRSGPIRFLKSEWALGAKVMGTDCPHVRIRDRRNGVEDIVFLAGNRARKHRPDAVTQVFDQRLLGKVFLVVYRGYGPLQPGPVSTSPGGGGQQINATISTSSTTRTQVNGLMS
jgi:hypothetical protein